MPRTIRGLTLTALTAIAVPLAFMAATATAANAAPSCVPSPYTGHCNSKTVEGNALGYQGSNGIYIHNAPTDTTASRVGFLPLNNEVPTFCYATGTVEQGPGSLWANDNDWDFIDYNGVTGYVSDAWLYTDGTITGQVFACVSGLT